MLQPYILCDGNSASGLGHFMRCCALANAMSTQHCRPHLLGDFIPTAQQLAAMLEIELTVNETPIQKRPETLPPASDIILDSYVCQPGALDTRHRYVLIDDFCRFDSCPVLGVINFTVDAHQYDYGALGAHAQALGTRFFLPHPLIGPPCDACTPEPKNIMVMIGSGDRHGLAPRILKALSSVGSFQIRVIGSHSDATRNKFPQVEFITPTPEIGRHYEWADFCITSGGLAKYECAWLGKPAAVISQTPGEQAETKQFQRHGLCFDLGYCTDVTAEKTAEKLANILSDRHARQQAHESCRQHFSNDSPRAAAEFILECLNP